MSLKSLAVQPQRRLSEHTQGQVDQLKFRLREPTGHHDVEDVVGQLYVIDAVAPVGRQLLRCEVAAALPLGVQHFGAFLPHLVVFGEGLKASALLDAVDSTGHAQCVEQRLRADVKSPRHDRAIEHHIVRQHRRVGPVILGHELLDASVRTAEPLGLAVVDLHPHPNDLEAGVTDVFFRGDLRQRIVLVVVGLEVERDDVHVLFLVHRRIEVVVEHRDVFGVVDSAAFFLIASGIDPEPRNVASRVLPMQMVGDLLSEITIV